LRKIKNFFFLLFERSSFTSSSLFLSLSPSHFFFSMALIFIGRNNHSVHARQEFWSQVAALPTTIRRIESNKTSSLMASETLFYKFVFKRVERGGTSQPIPVLFTILSEIKYDPLGLMTPLLRQHTLLKFQELSRVQEIQWQGFFEGYDKVSTSEISGTDQVMFKENDFEF